MNEIDLICAYIERHNCKVTDVCYHNESCAAIADAFVYDFGYTIGLRASTSYYFGNVNLRATINGVVVLTNTNLIGYNFVTILREKNEVVLQASLGVNLGMSLLGSGGYEGNRRIYGIGFNRLTVNLYGFGAATFTLRADFNGYKFETKTG